MRNAAITGWGMAVPERVLTNADLERMVETSDEWITSRTGIKERRIVGAEDSTTSLSVTAARQAPSISVLLALGSSMPWPSARNSCRPVCIIGSWSSASIP